MTSPEAVCPDCRQQFDEADNYCRHCGMFLAATRDVTVVERPLPPTTTRPSLPAPVRKVATALVVGAAVQIGVTVAGKYIAKQAAKQAIAAHGKGRGKKRRNNGSHADDLPEDVTAVNETVVVHRAWTRQ